MECHGDGDAGEDSMVSKDEDKGAAVVGEGRQSSGEVMVESKELQRDSGGVGGLWRSRQRSEEERSSGEIVRQRQGPRDTSEARPRTVKVRRGFCKGGKDQMNVQ